MTAPDRLIAAPRAKVTPEEEKVAHRLGRKTVVQPARSAHSAENQASTVLVPPRVNGPNEPRAPLPEPALAPDPDPGDLHPAPARPTGLRRGGEDPGHPSTGLRQWEENPGANAPTAADHPPLSPGHGPSALIRIGQPSRRVRHTAKGASLSKKCQPGSSVRQPNGHHGHPSSAPRDEKNLTASDPNRAVEATSNADRARPPAAASKDPPPTETALHAAKVQLQPGMARAALHQRGAKDPPPAAAPNRPTAPNPPPAPGRHEREHPELQIGPEKEPEKAPAVSAQNPGLAGHQTARNAAAHVLAASIPAPNGPEAPRAEDAEDKSLTSNRWQSPYSSQHIS